MLILPMSQTLVSEEKMNNLTKSEKQLIEINFLQDNYQQHLIILQVQILRQKLQEERQRDKEVYQSLKNKISTH
jgi:hypothetical protein